MCCTTQHTVCLDFVVVAERATISRLGEHCAGTFLQSPAFGKSTSTFKTSRGELVQRGGHAPARVAEGGTAAPLSRLRYCREPHCRSPPTSRSMQNVDGLIRLDHRPPQIGHSHPRLGIGRDGLEIGSYRLFPSLLGEFFAHQHSVGRGPRHNCRGLVDLGLDVMGHAYGVASRTGRVSNPHACARACCVPPGETGFVH